MDDTWIRCEDELPPMRGEILLLFVPLPPGKPREIIGQRLHFPQGMFLGESDAFRPLTYFSHWKPIAQQS